MNELKKAAKEYADGFERLNPNQDVNVQSARIVGFKRGAEWKAKQSPWIQCNTNILPNNNQLVLVRAGYKQDIIYLASFHHEEFYSQGEVVHFVRSWMPIPSFDDILEANKDVLLRMKEKGDNNENT